MLCWPKRARRLSLAAIDGLGGNPAEVPQLAFGEAERAHELWVGARVCKRDGHQVVLLVEQPDRLLRHQQEVRTPFGAQVRVHREDGRGRKFAAFFVMGEPVRVRSCFVKGFAELPARSHPR